MYITATVIFTLFFFFIPLSTRFSGFKTLVCKGIALFSDTAIMYTYVFPTQGGLAAFTKDIGDRMQSGQQNSFFCRAASNVYTVKERTNKIIIYLSLDRDENSFDIGSEGYGKIQARTIRSVQNYTDLRR